MLTPEQQKLFRFLYLLANSYGTNFMEFEVEFDDYLSDDPLDSNTFSRSGWGKSTIEIPEKAAQELTDFINENVVPKLESTLDLIFRENGIVMKFKIVFLEVMLKRQVLNILAGEIVVNGVQKLKSKLMMVELLWYHLVMKLIFG